MFHRPSAQPPADGRDALSRRNLLRASAAAGALIALSSLPEFTPRAAGVARTDASLVPDDEAVTLWYKTWGAKDKLVATGLPIGNGRLGAMVSGHPTQDALVLADATLWTGDANDVLIPMSSDYPNYKKFSYDPNHYGTFGVLAKAYLDLPAHTESAISDYRRTLDMSNGLVTATYKIGGVKYRREVFSSQPDDVIVIRLTQSGGGSYTGSLTLAGTRGEKVTANPSAAEASFAAAFPNSLKYATLIKAAGTGGTVSATGAKVTFTKCTEVVLILSGGTNYKADHSVQYKDGAKVPIDVARSKATWASIATGAQLRSTHVADYQDLYQRMTLSLGTSSAALRKMDTKERLAAHAAAGSAPDPELEAAYLQFGRYLTITGSRYSLPTNLQGLWIDTNSPEWSSDYHTDINVEMNYWLPDRVGLSECFDPFTDYCVAQLPGWQAATKKHFQDSSNLMRNTSGKVAGWTITYSLTIWGGFAGMWNPAGNAWLCNSLYEHYEYTQDRKHLEKIYPLLKGACEFWEARLIATKVGGREVLIDDHDRSPEHGKWDEKGITYAQELVWQLFKNYRAAAATLGKDAAYASTIARLQKKLYLPEVSATSGRLEEWMSDSNSAGAEKTHRHLSAHMGLFPGDRINLQDSPKALVDGARKLLEDRGMNSVGWASAWRAMCWARLKDPEKAYQLVRTVMKPSVNQSNGSAVNMFDMMSWGGKFIFQIDANYGTPVAMIEMLVQSRTGRVELLPALPKAWEASGSFKGVGLRGGLTLDMSWASGRVTTATLRGAPGRSTTVFYGKWSQKVTIPAGGSATVTPPAKDPV
ncbi:glycoside hydrolase family 95 protein [Streptomyces tubercidicus]|uniref:glycoside hydrolase family 95 protein n=1 Tax=Streptomyces tubercidicus TaxID=47759 RepID=UPI003465B04C